MATSTLDLNSPSDEDISMKVEKIQETLRKCKEAVAKRTQEIRQYNKSLCEMSSEWQTFGVNDVTTE
jgi:hypothetical protein